LGTVTVRELLLAALTVAFTVPKYTILPAAVLLKPEPLMVTVVPTGPEAGVKPEIAGCAHALSGNNTLQKIHKTLM
jgi:hypothetical protein